MEEEQIPKKTKRKSAFKKTADWASLIRNFATIVASFISLITLFILLRQNERTYQPDLVLSPEPGVFQVEYRDTISACDDLRIVHGADSIRDKLALRATNLGLGAAKNLQITWHFDPNRLDDTVSVGSHKIVTGMAYREEVGGLLFKSCLLKESPQEMVEYCLPVNAEKEPMFFSLPLNYIRLWTNLTIRVSRSGNLSRQQRIQALEKIVTQFQDLRCSITYKDINNKRYQKTYHVQIVPHFLDLRSKRLTLGIRLFDNHDTQRRQHQFAIYEPNAAFYESTIEL